MEEQIMKCANCGGYAENTVREPNICQDVPICGDCKKGYEQCSVCDEFYHAETMKDGKCENCRDNDY